MAHPWFTDIDWAALEEMKVEPVYKPPLTSESDTQFFSKEFTKVEILNPEDDTLYGNDDGSNALDFGGVESDLSPDSVWEGELECLYSAKVHEDADNNCEFDQFCQSFN